MAKCSECGFLAVWDVRTNNFDMATEEFRQTGIPADGGIINASSYKAKCFIQQCDLVKEIKDKGQHGDWYVLAIKESIQRHRDCDGYRSWIHGFDAKEHRQMMFEDEHRTEARRHANISLGVAIIGSLMAAGMTLLAAFLGANATRESTKWQVEALQNQTKAQLEMTKMQIEAQREIAKVAPIPQVIVKMPPVPAK